MRLDAHLMRAVLVTSLIRHRLDQSVGANILKTSPSPVLREHYWAVEGIPMKFEGTFCPNRDPSLIYHYSVTVTRMTPTSHWEAEIRCNGEVRRPINGFIDYAPLTDIALQAMVECLVRDSIEQRLGID